MGQNSGSSLACAIIDLTMSSNVQFLHSATLLCCGVRGIVSFLCILFSSQNSSNIS